MKLFNLIATSILGAAMVIGGGVAAANASKSVNKADADSTTAFSFTKSGSTNTVTSGYELVLTNYKEDTTNGFYSDKNSTVGLDIGVKKSSGTIWSATPSSISLTVKVGGGSTRDPLTNNVTANLIDSSGSEIAGTAVTVTTKVEEKTGTDYVVSVPVANNAAGIMIHHEKETSYNIRIYAISMSYVANAGTSFNITTSGVVNGTVTGATSIQESGSATITLVPNAGYKLPSSSESITVTGATISSYSSSTGELVLSNPTGPVSVSVTLQAASQYTISTSLTGLTASGATSMYENESASVTLSVIDSVTKALPSSITVTNAISYDYNSLTGVVTINGATGNVTITAAAMNKPAEVDESFSTASSWTVVTTNEEYTTTNDLITASWTKGTSSSNAGAYWNPGRFYKNHVLTISAATGAGAVTTIKSVEFTCSSGSSGTPSVNYNDALYNSAVSVTKPTSSPGTVSKAQNGLVITYTMSGTVTEIQIVFANQTRIPTFVVTYDKDQSDVDLQSISATCDEVLVSQQVTPVVTFNPVGATNKNLSYEIISGSEYAHVDSDTGVVTGLGAGTAQLRIIPEDTHASPITVNVVVHALPDISTVVVGKKYSMTASLNAIDFELTGMYASGSTAYGSTTNYTDDPSNSFPVRVVNGLYAKTVALEVTIEANTKYLSFDSSNSNNNLVAVNSIDRSSSWIFAEEESQLVIRNVDVYARKLAATTSGNPAVGRFACYQNLSSTVITPTFNEIAEAKTDKECVQDFVDLYLHMDDYNENKGWCKDGEHSYYLTAKAGLNNLTDDQIALFRSDSDFDAAQARYEKWAEYNNDAEPYDGFDYVHTPLHANSSIIVNNSNAAVIIIVSCTILALASVGAVMILRKRRYSK